MEDRELLQDYAERRSEAAFTELVRRHLDWIHAAALRQTDDHALAEDVTQSVFALLARKATSLKSDTRISGWLFNTTRFVATRARRAEIRRLRREQSISVMNPTPPDDSELAWQSLGPQLDEAVAALSESDRAVVLWRFYERKPLAEVGARLGTTEEGARKRIRRAVDKMREFLMQRGVTLSVAALGAFLGQRVVTAAPNNLLANVVRVALAPAGSALLPELAREALTAWRWTRVKIVAGLTTAASIVMLCFWPQTGLLRSAPGTDATSAGNSAASAAPGAILPDGVSPTDAKVPRPQPSGPALMVAVLDQGTGRGLGGASVYYNCVLNDEWQQHQGFVTDERGLCSIAIPREGLGRLDLGVVKDGFLARYATWFPFRDDPVPPNHVFKLSAAERLGGVVVDHANQPVANAAIHFTFSESGDAASRETPRERIGSLEWFPVARTGPDGRWQCAITAPRSSDYYFTVKHAAYPSTSFHIGETGLSPNELRSQNAVMRLGLARQLTGVVTDLREKPIAGARVWLGYDQKPEVQAFTDTQGRFTLAPLKDTGCITAVADGFAPTQSDLDTNATLAPVVFRLQASPILRVRVIDQDSNPVHQAIIALEKWPEGLRNTVHFRNHTDAHGRLEWHSAPTGAVSICALKTGYRAVREVEIIADGVEHTITLPPALVVTGRVTDADTGEPIQDFKASPGYGVPRTSWYRGDSRPGRNGAYRLVFAEAGEPVVQIRAAGYEPGQMEVSPLSATEATQDFELRRLDKSPGIRGTVHQPDGTPAAGVEVALCSVEVGVTLTGKSFGSRLNSRSGGVPPREHLTTTDANGEFQFRRVPGAHTVFAVGPAGLGQARLRDLEAPVSIVLQAWGQITGTVRIRGQAAAGRKVVWIGPGTLTDWETLNYAYESFSTTTDNEGRFTLTEVPPRDAYVAVRDGDGKPVTHQAHVVVTPGGQVQVSIGGTGVQLTGRLTAPGWEALDWASQVESAELKSTWKGFTNMPRNLPPAALQEWRLDVWESPQAVALRAGRRAYGVAIGPNGTLAVPDVEPGQYDLTITIRGAQPGRPAPLRANREGHVTSRLHARVLVPEDMESSSVNLGEVQMR